MKRKTIGSKYGTQVMREEEVLLFMQAAVESGSEIKEALQDMKMIDAMLQMERLNLGVKGYVAKTKKGNYRKGTTIYDAFDGILNARVEGAFDY